MALLILLVGPLLLFNPWFVSALQDRHLVADAFGTTRSEVDRVTGYVLGDLATGGDFVVALDGEPLLDDAERSHMRDVSRLVRILAAVALLAGAVTAVCAWVLRHERRRRAGIVVRTAVALALAGALVAVTFAVAFEPAFLAFHAIFFPPGTYLFAPGSDLITLFPGGFWFEASLAAGAAVLLSALLALALGLAGVRRSPPASAA